MKWRITSLIHYCYDPGVCISLMHQGFGVLVRYIWYHRYHLGSSHNIGDNEVFHHVVGVKEFYQPRGVPRRFVGP